MCDSEVPAALSTDPKTMTMQASDQMIPLREKPHPEPDGPITRPMMSQDEKSNYSTELSPGQTAGVDGTPDADCGSSPRTWRAVWYDFTQNTTLHGVNKITEDTPFTLRRVMWLLIVAGGLTLFSFQLINNVMHYWSWPVTVNVKINYNDTLLFPTVTVCNQNDFRATRTFQLGKYQLVRDYYSNLSRGGIDLDPYNATKVTLDDIYLSTSHTKHDMIAHCSWLGLHCTPDDFDTIATDYGYCFTFNGGRQGGHIRNISATGADRGLRMSLNLEQYEYMKGPNPGAGIKILIHDQKDTPLVKDLGQAIPPGSHAYVGIQIVQVNNLKPPHGKCDDKRELSYYDSYSVSACAIECKMTYLAEKCGCRDTYMPHNDQGFPPVCTLDRYQSCYQTFIDEFNQLQDPCTCAIPCQRTLFDPTITYAAISNYDTDVYLRSERMNDLRMRYHHALEVAQLVDDDIVSSDRKSFSTLKLTLDGLKQRAIEAVVTSLKEAKAQVEGLYESLEERVRFHRRWGLSKIKYVADHNFVRGWDVMDERTFSLVTGNYQEVAAYIFRAMDIMSESNASSEYPLRASAYIHADADLFKFRVLANRALQNLSEFYESYKRGIPLLNFKVSPRKRYDTTYVSLDIVRTSDSELDEKAKMAQKRLGQYLTAIETLRESLKNVLDGGSYDKSHIRTQTKALEKAARSYNYYRFFLKDRVASKPTKIVDGIIKSFEDLYQNLQSSHMDLIMFIDDFQSSMSKDDLHWTEVEKFTQQCIRYSLQSEGSKRQLAQIAVSDELEHSIRQVKASLDSVRTRSREIESKLMQVQDAYTQTWRIMMGEKSLDAFYQKIAGDIALLKNGSTESSGILSVFRYMLKEAHDWPTINNSFVEDNLDSLPTWMNGDFAGADIDEKVGKLTHDFGNVRALFHTYYTLEDEDLFMDSMSTIKQHLQEFAKVSQINNDFFRENFLEVDVFMKELSYEQIDQQIAYDQTNLWSDIGGSMGLFIGASVITVFELLDVIFHNMARQHCGRRRRPSSDRKQSYTA